MKCYHDDCFTCPYPDCIADDVREMHHKKVEGQQDVIGHQQKNIETRQRREMFKEYVRKWDFDKYPLMPIAEKEAEWLIEIFDRIDNRRKYSSKYYLENLDKKESRA